MAWWPRRPDPDDLGYFHAGLRALTPRGPDEQGQWHAPDGSCHLGHRRLRITGLRGVQPIWNAERTVCILVNGEFYDARLLRERLITDGYSFTTDSDSELLLPLYAKHGLDAVHHLEGEFAFVLWDTTKRLVWAVRDRAGVKPLRFTHDARGLAFASEAKALFAAGWKARWDASSLAQALTVQYVQPDRTLFAGVRQLAPGQSIVFQQTDEGAWQENVHQWWNWFSNPITQHLDPSTAEQALRTALRQAVSRRVDTHWPIAAHLSGGLDSTAITLLASQLHPGQVRAYTVGFDAPDEGGEVEHDECRVARTTAHKLGLHWTRVEASRELIVRHWADATARAEAFGINGHLVAKWLLAQRIHEDGLRVSLSGEGADENLLGYAFLAAESAAQDAAALTSANPVARGVMLPQGDQVNLDRVRAAWGHVPVWLQAKASLGARLHTLLDPDWIERHCGEALSSWATATPPSGTHAVHQAAATWARNALGGYILPTLADAPESGFAIEGRVPFLDRDLMETVQQWDPESTGWPLTAKAPLRQLLADAGLEEAAARPKHPFEAPPLWGCAWVREYLRVRWTKPDAFAHTPVCQGRVIEMMDMLDHGDTPMRQLWEPVVATLLSLDCLQESFDLQGCDAIA